ncbi:hypothetical protein A7982_12913 [Minicystis rosea]|nr:hypothetical protein A7982_12913 [Minicystis rosea]
MDANLRSGGIIVHTRPRDDVHRGIELMGSRGSPRIVVLR